MLHKRSTALVACLLLSLAACLPAQAPGPQAQAPAPTDTLPAPTYIILLPESAASTPFQPLPVTGTPPPTSTPIPTPQPSPTPSPTPWLQPTFAPPSEPVSGIPAPFPLLSPDHQTNFLLLGSDSRGGASFRTDVFMIAIVDRREVTVTLISVPRDLWVYIPGWTMNRINTAYLHGELTGYPGGGIGQVRDTVLYNFGIRIDHVALIDFDGFRRVVNRAGGIDVPIACPFTEWMVIDPNVSLELESNWELVTVGPGLVHMDGEMALWYARARQRSNDFDRGRRQQEVIRALFTAALENDLILKAPDLYDDLRETVETDIDLQTILQMVPFALQMDEARIRSYYIGDQLTWGWMTPGGASVLLPDRENIYRMLLEAIAPPPDVPEEGPVLVEVWNRSGTDEYDLLAAERLHYAGFATELLDPGDPANKTQLYVLTEHPDPDVTSLLLDLFDLDESRLKSTPIEGAEAAYRLVIGSDYDPCFR